MRRAVAGTALALLVGGGAVAAGAAPTAGDLLDHARQAAEQLSFVGLVEVRWNDATGAHADDLLVQAAGGTLVVRGAQAAMEVADRRRLFELRSGEWDLVWSPALASPDRPDSARKYRTTVVGRQLVAGRSATVSEVREGTVLRERLYVDEATGLLLRREQVDPTARVQRAVGFATITVDQATPVPLTPVGPADKAPRRLAVDELPPAASAPAELIDGYRRVGVYRDAGTVHVLYSDGLYDLSVFEQRGRLEADVVPRPRFPVTVGSRRAWAWSGPAGQVVVWHAGHTVFTGVSDAPLDQMLAALRSMPPPRGRPSLLDKLRRASQELLVPLAA
jgi:hypothetical protein